MILMSRKEYYRPAESMKYPPTGIYLIQKINSKGFLERIRFEGFKRNIPKGYSVFKTITAEKI